MWFELLTTTARQTSENIGVLGPKVRLRVVFSLVRGRRCETQRVLELRSWNCRLRFCAPLHGLTHKLLTQSTENTCFWRLGQGFGHVECWWGWTHWNWDTFEFSWDLFKRCRRRLFSVFQVYPPLNLTWISVILIMSKQRHNEDLGF